VLVGMRFTFVVLVAIAHSVFEKEKKLRLLSAMR
jgi:hypothetical protein